MLKFVPKYFRQIFHVKLEDQVVMQEIYQQITDSLNKAYDYPQTQKYLRSLTVQSLLSKSVQYYVGSRAAPRNQRLMLMLLEIARQKAEQRQNQKQLNLVRYYYAYYVKMGSIKDGNPQQYDRSSDMFIQLAQNGDPLSNYLVGKQMYKLVESGQIGRQWKDQKDLNKMKQLFINSVCSHQFGGLYYVADTDQRFRGQNKVTQDSQNMLFQLYCQSASLGYRLSYFKIAQIYKKRNNFKLYKKYLLQASQQGVIEAQHNLGVEYTNGQHFPKDEVKALAWFLHAAAHGFVYSKYNLSKILAQGSSCGRILPNKKASLIYLEEINRSGEIDVTKQIKQLVGVLQKNDPKDGTKNKQKKLQL